MLELTRDIPPHQLHLISVLISHRDHSYNQSVKHILQEQYYKSISAAMNHSIHFTVI